jgi:hypothetical protein
VDENLWMQECENIEISRKKITIPKFSQKDLQLNLSFCLLKPLSSGRSLTQEPMGKKTSSTTITGLFPYFCLGTIPFAMKVISGAPTTSVLVASAAVYVSGTAMALGTMMLNSDHERKAILAHNQEQMAKLRYRESTFEKLSSSANVERYTAFSNAYRSKI